MFKEGIFEDFFKELSENRQYSSYGGKCIDIFYKSYSVKNPDHLIDYAVQLVNEFWSRNPLKSELQIGIYIELIDAFTHLKRVPRTKEEFNGEIYMHSVPDIGISDISKGSRPNPQFEQYLSPLPFKLEGLNKEVTGFYREYRLHDEEFDWEQTYTREVFFAV